MTTARRLTFLVHPCCYAASLGVPASMPRERWERYHAHELTVLPRWYAGLAAMDESDLVVYHLCYQSAEEKALAECLEALRLEPGNKTALANLAWLGVDEDAAPAAEAPSTNDGGESPAEPDARIPPAGWDSSLAGFLRSGKPEA